MNEREFIIMIWRGLNYYAADPRTGDGQRRGLLLVASALEQKYGLPVAPKNPHNRKARRLVPTEQEAKQDKEILDALVPMC